METFVKVSTLFWWKLWRWSFLTVCSDLPSKLRRTKRLMTASWGISWSWGELWSKCVSLSLFWLMFNNVFTCFFSNQSAAQKMSLEDEIKRCQTLLTSAARRSHTAQVTPSSIHSVFWDMFKKLMNWFPEWEHNFYVLFVLLQLVLAEISRDQKLTGLHRELTDSRTLLSKLDEVIHRWGVSGPSNKLCEENSISAINKVGL